MALQNRCYMCILWIIQDIYSVVITWQPNPPISQFSRLCNKFTSVWSMFPCNTYCYQLMLSSIYKQKPFSYLQSKLYKLKPFSYLQSKLVEEEVEEVLDTWHNTVVCLFPLYVREDDTSLGSSHIWTIVILLLMVHYDLLCYDDQKDANVVLKVKQMTSSKPIDILYICKGYLASLIFYIFVKGI